MKKRRFLFCFLILYSVSGFSQIGYLGKRAHFQFETRFSPAWSNLDFNAKQGPFRFNYDIIPSIEYVFGKSWSVSGNYQYYKTCFTISGKSELKYYTLEDNIYRWISYGNLTVHGFGIHVQYYFNRNAPMGYYLKFGLDNYFYKASAGYTGYDSVVVVPSGYYDTKEYRHFLDPGTYSATKWGMGIRFEIGKNFFLGRYVSLGTAFSFGLLFRGWKNMFLVEPGIMDYADKRMLSGYLAGISIKIGLIPF